MAAWAGAAAAELEPLYDRLVTILKGMRKLFADETRCPVLDPGRGKTKPGYFWALACDDRPWGSLTPPAVIYSYAPGRGGKYVDTLLKGFSGILQVDGYDGYNILARPGRAAAGGGSSKLKRADAEASAAGRWCSRIAGRTCAGIFTRLPPGARRRRRLFLAKNSRC